MIADQVALLADGIPERRVQIGGVDDGRAGANPLGGVIHVKFARPVAALTTDCVTVEDWLAILVNRRRHGMSSVRVTVKASGPDRPIKVVIRDFKTGREIPPAFLGIPVDG